MAIAGGLLGCCFVFVLAFAGLMVGSVFVRAAVSFANRIVGPVKPPDTFGLWDDWDSDEPPPRPRKSKGEKKIPEPGLASGMLITFVTGVANAAAYFVLAVLFGRVLDDGPDFDEPAAAVLGLGLGLPLSGFVLTLVLVPLLPTTFTRAALVAFIHHALVIGFTVVVVGIVYAAWLALGG